MEDTGASFDLLKSRKDGLRGAYEQLRSQASSFLEFGLKWKEFEESLNSEFEKLVVRRKETASMEEEFIIAEKSLQQCSENLELKLKEMDGIQKSLEECQKELKLKKEQLNETNTLLAEKGEELEELVKRLKSKMDLSKEYDEQIEKKENIHYQLEQSVQERSAQLDLKEMRLHKLEKELEDCTKKLQEKQKQKQTETVQRNLAKYHDNVKGKKSEGRTIQSDSAKHNDEPKQKMDQLQSTRGSVTGAGEEFTEEEGKLDLLQKILHKHVSKQKDVDHFRERTEVPEARVKQQLVSVQRSAEDEMLLRPKVNAVLHHAMPESNLRAEEHTHFVSNNELKKYEKVPSELYAVVVQKSHDPAESTLLLMKEMYPLQARRRSIFLLDELKKTSPSICSKVRKEAINFASEWKQESTVGNTVLDDFDALAFLKFLGTYKLESYFGTDELLKILKLVDQQTVFKTVPAVNDNRKGIKRPKKDDEEKASSPRIS